LREWLKQAFCTTQTHPDFSGTANASELRRLLLAQIRQTETAPTGEHIAWTKQDCGAATAKPTF
jgi:hypothetical protein